MKHTLTQKIKSVLYNILRTRLKDLYNHYIKSGKVEKFLDNKFAGDLTKETDYDQRDYTLDGSEGLPEIDRNVKFMIDQSLAWRTRNSCVPLSMYLTLCHNFNLTPDRKEFLGLLDYFEREKVWRENGGASAPVLIRKFVPKWNELHPNNPAEYRRVFYNSDGYKELLSKGYAVSGGRKVFKAYTVDLLDRRIDQSAYDDEKRLGGHYVGVMLGSILKKLRMIELSPKGEQIDRKYDILTDQENIVNQYPTRNKAYNLYAHDQMDSHTKRGIWYSWFYSIIPLGGVAIKRIEDLELSIESYNINVSPTIFNKAVVFIKELEEKGVDPSFYNTISTMPREDRIAFDIANQYKTGLLSNFNINSY